MSATKIPKRRTKWVFTSSSNILLTTTRKSSFFGYTPCDKCKKPCTTQSNSFSISKEKPDGPGNDYHLHFTRLYHWPDPRGNDSAPTNTYTLLVVGEHKI